MYSPLNACHFHEKGCDVLRSITNLLIVSIIKHRSRESLTSNFIDSCIIVTMLQHPNGIYQVTSLHIHFLAYKIAKSIASDLVSPLVMCCKTCLMKWFVQSDLKYGTNPDNGMHPVLHSQTSGSTLTRDYVITTLYFIQNSYHAISLFCRLFLKLVKYNTLLGRYTVHYIFCTCL